MILPVNDKQCCDDQDLATFLTPRQLMVLAQLVAGKTNREIARDLLIAEHTVETHLRDIYQRLGVRNRVGASRLYTLWIARNAASNMA